jgi:hypothetical protein
MKRWSCSIPGPSDVELALKRPSPILYHGTAPDEQARGLVFIVHGFGQDTNSEYDLHLREHVARTYRMAAVTVEYHCYRSRPPLGAQINVSPDALFKLEALARQSGIQESFSATRPEDLVEILGRRLLEPTEVPAELVPPNGDYQNFGVMQALDHLYVLRHLVEQDVAFDRRRIWLFGSSHGGYLAHLIHKFAPNSFSALIDNSGYTRANHTYLGLGPEVRIPVGQLTFACNVITRWTFSDVYSPTCFGIAQDLIRQTAFRPHQVESARVSGRGCRIRMVNLEQDPISPIGAKILQHQGYRKTGFDSELVRLGDPGALPEYVKSMTHGDVSLKRLLDHFAPTLLDHQSPNPLDGELGTELSFDCLEATYRIRHLPQSPGVELSILRS